MLAYLLINTERGNEQEIYDDINSFPEVIGVHMIFGEWDLMAKLEVENSEALSTFILDKIRGINGVQMTSTLIVAK